MRAILGTVLGLASLVGSLHAQPIIIPLSPQPQREPPPPPPASPVPIAPASRGSQPSVVFNGQQTGDAGGVAGGAATPREDSKPATAPQSQLLRRQP